MNDYYTQDLTSEERAVYQCLAAKGFPREMAHDEALDGVSIETARQMVYGGVNGCDCGVYVWRRHVRTGEKMLRDRGHHHSDRCSIWGDRAPVIEP